MPINQFKVPGEREVIAVTVTNRLVFERLLAGFLKKGLMCFHTYTPPKANKITATRASN